MISNQEINQSVAQQEEGFYWVHKTLIVPSSIVEQVRYLASLFGESSSNMWKTGLSENGKYPCSHYIGTGLIGSDFNNMLSSPENLVNGAMQVGIELDINTATYILSQSTISDLNYQEVLQEMNLKICTEEEVI